MDDVLLMDLLEAIAYLPEYINYLSLTEFSSFSLDVGFEVGGAILQKKVEMVFSFGWLIKP
jgi:hypothetical protein